MYVFATEKRVNVFRIHIKDLSWGLTSLASHQYQSIWQSYNTYWILNSIIKKKLLWFFTIFHFSTVLLFLVGKWDFFFILSFGQLKKNHNKNSNFVIVFQNWDSKDIRLEFFQLKRRLFFHILSIDDSRQLSWLILSRNRKCRPISRKPPHDYIESFTPHIFLAPLFLPMRH